MRTAGVISGVSVSHARACVDEIESATSDDLQFVVDDLLARDGVSEAFALQTCNRAEAYVVTDEAADGYRALSTFAPDVRDGAVVYMDHEESLRHLMRVAAGLESLVIGEDQILGQFRSAIETARAVGGVGTLFEHALTKALHVGERARTETQINEGVVSLGSAAVKLAERELTLGATDALVVGAGKMGTLTARALDDAGVASVVVANRSVDSAEGLADELSVPARAASLDALPSAVAEATLVITATSSPDYVVDAAAVDGAGETVLIDIAQPRDIDPTVDAHPGVTTYDIDALESVTEATREQREEAAERVESMIDDEFERLLDTYKRRRADEAISAMYESAERVKARELDTALAKLEAQGGLTDEQRETVAALADALVGQMLAPPTKSLRDAAGEDDWTTIQTAMRLFDPQFGGRPETPSGATPQSAEKLPDELPSHVLEQSSDD